MKNNRYKKETKDVFFVFGMTIVGFLFLWLEWQMLWLQNWNPLVRGLPLLAAGICLYIIIFRTFSPVWQELWWKGLFPARRRKLPVLSPHWKAPEKKVIPRYTIIYTKKGKENFPEPESPPWLWHQRL